MSTLAVIQIRYLGRRALSSSANINVLAAKKVIPFRLPFASVPGMGFKGLGTVKTLCTATTGSVDNQDIYGDVPGVQSTGDKMVLMFTCTVCNTRSARKISKQAYQTGIVMVRCAGCNNRHLIADRMGVFEDSIDSSPADGNHTHGSAATGTGGWDIQKYLQKELGQGSKYITDDNVYELTMNDIVGAKVAVAQEHETVVNKETDK